MLLLTALSYNFIMRAALSTISNNFPRPTPRDDSTTFPMWRAITTLWNDPTPRPAPQDEETSFPDYQDIVENLTPQNLSDVNTAIDAAIQVLGQAATSLIINQTIQQTLDSAALPSIDTLSIAMPEEDDDHDYPLPSDLADVDPSWWDEHPHPDQVVYPIEVVIHPPASPSDRMLTSPP